MNHIKKLDVPQSFAAPMPKTFIFVALECEAKALIRFYHLKKDMTGPSFLLYRSEKIILTVSGVGKVAMAGAVAYTLGRFNFSLYPIILNIGIAGHKTYGIGDLYRAMKVVDVDSKKVFYPSLITNTLDNTAVLKTVSSPVSHYMDQELYDMEGAAFYEIAMRFSSSELIQCFKVVSDNQLCSIDKINAKKIISWIDAHVDQIEILSQQLLILSDQLEPEEPIEYQQLIEQWHFTASGRLRLKAMLRRWKVLTNGAPLIVDEMKYSNGKELIKAIETELNRLDFFL